jgi:hypothetical protein
VVGTVVLIIVFVSSVYDRLAMPEFSEKLLGADGNQQQNITGFQVSRAITTSGDSERRGGKDRVAIASPIVLGLDCWD